MKTSEDDSFFTKTGYIEFGPVVDIIVDNISVILKLSTSKENGSREEEKEQCYLGNILRDLRAASKTLLPDGRVARMARRYMESKVTRSCK